MCRLEAIIGKSSEVIAYHNHLPFGSVQLRRCDATLSHRAVSMLIDYLGSERRWQFPVSSAIADHEHLLASHVLTSFDVGRSSEVINVLRSLDVDVMCVAYAREDLVESLRVAVDLLIEAVSSLGEEEMLVVYCHEEVQI